MGCITGGRCCTTLGTAGGGGGGNGVCGIGAVGFGAAVGYN